MLYTIKEVVDMMEHVPTRTICEGCGIEVEYIFETTEGRFCPQCYDEHYFGEMY